MPMMPEWTSTASRTLRVSCILLNQAKEQLAKSAGNNELIAEIDNFLAMVIKDSK